MNQAQKDTENVAIVSPIFPRFFPKSHPSWTCPNQLLLSLLKTLAFNIYSMITGLYTQYIRIDLEKSVDKKNYFCAFFSQFRWRTGVKKTHFIHLLCREQLWEHLQKQKQLRNRLLQYVHQSPKRTVTGRFPLFSLCFYLLLFAHRLTGKWDFKNPNTRSVMYHLTFEFCGTSVAIVEGTLWCFDLSLSKRIMSLMAAQMNGVGGEGSACLLFIMSFPIL